MAKSDVIQIRVSESEKASFERAAEISGISLSAWSRQRLRWAAIKDLQYLGEKIEFLEPIPLKRNGDGN